MIKIHGCVFLLDSIFNQTGPFPCYLDTRPGDCFAKNHPLHHHREMWPIYFHIEPAAEKAFAGGVIITNRNITAK